MASASAAKIELVRRDARAAASALRRRIKEQRMEGALVRKGAVVTTAALYGTLNRFDIPVSVGGFPWKLAVITGALIGEAMSKGPVQSIMGGVADASLAIYIERSITTESLIAGDGSGYYEEEAQIVTEGGELD